MQFSNLKQVHLSSLTCKHLIILNEPLCENVCKYNYLNYAWTFLWAFKINDHIIHYFVEINMCNGYIFF